MGERPRIGSAERRARLKFAALVVVGWLAVIWVWPVAPLALTVDDSFYYFGIARSILAGNGPTLAGVEPTSGFHPLWCALLVPLVGLARVSPEFFVRVVLTLQLGLVAVGIWRIGRVVPPAVPIFAVGALVFSFAKIFVNGLESGLELLLLALAIEVAKERRRLVLLGVLCGLLTLARLSAVVGAGLFLAVAIRRSRPRWNTALWASLAFVLPIGGYALFLYQRFGHFVPISGAIKYGHVPHWSWILPLAVIAGGLSIEREWRSRSWPFWATPLIGWVAFQTACDATFRRMILPEIWYLVPHATLLILAAGLASTRFPRILRVGGILVSALAIVSAYLRLQPVTYSFYVQAREAGRWLASNTPVDARVGGWDSGIEAFYSNRLFFNLDGLASSWRFKNDYLDRGRRREFIDDRKIEYLAQWVPKDSDPPHFLRLDPSEWEIVYDVPFAFRGFFTAQTEHRYIILHRR